MASLTVTPTTLTLNIGASAQLSAFPRGGVTWYTHSPQIALVTAGGSVTARASGTGTVIARKGNNAAAVKVTVTTSVEPPPPVVPDPPPLPIDPPPVIPPPVVPPPVTPPPVVVPPVEPPPVVVPPVDPPPVVIPPPTTATDITAANLKFRGYIRFTRDPWFMGASAGVGLALRTVNGVTKIFTQAIDGNPVRAKLLEFDLPTAPPTLDIATSPRCTAMVDHGNIYAKCFATSAITGAEDYGAVNPSGLLWDEQESLLWFTYGGPYAVSTPLHPTIGCVEFNGATLGKVYGPWRQQLHPNMTRGSLLAIPPSFGDRYLNGARMGVTSGSNSGIATCPRGSNLTGIVPFNPRTLPAATFPNPGGTGYDPAHAQVLNKTALMHDMHHRMARDTNYKVCFWSVEPALQNYDCKLNNAIFPGPSTFGGPLHLFDNENDSTNGSVFIETPTKQGWIVFGNLVTTPAGYDPGGSDPDKQVHCGYGDPNHGSNSGSGFEDGKCCHGQADPFWNGTGPFANLRVPMAWIYSPATLAKTATGELPPWGGAPHETIAFTENGGLAFPTIETQQRQGWFGQSPVFHAERKYIYVMMRGVDPTSAYGNGPGGSARQPAIGVFELVDG